PRQEGKLSQAPGNISRAQRAHGKLDARATDRTRKGRSPPGGRPFRRYCGLKCSGKLLADAFLGEEFSADLRTALHGVAVLAGRRWGAFRALEQPTRGATGVLAIAQG